MKRYVVGDIHGCFDQLQELYKLILDDADLDAFKIIFVGDYVDRGPDSKKVIDFIMKLQQSGHVALMGNHEDMILAGEFMYAEATLRSFDASYCELPEYVIKWMRSLPKYYEDDTIIVAHAGATPDIPMSEQKDTMLMWYRYPMNQSAFMGKHFYHGHTPFRSKSPEGAIDRLNVDTGCVYGGYLTAAIVGENGKPENILQVRGLTEKIDF